MTALSQPRPLRVEPLVLNDWIVTWLEKQQLLDLEPLRDLRDGISALRERVEQARDLRAQIDQAREDFRTFQDKMRSECVTRSSKGRL